MKLSLFLFLVVGALQVSAQTSVTKKCIDNKDLVTLSQDFKQLAPKPGEAAICEDDKDPQEYILISALLQLKQMQFEAVMPLSADDFYQGRFKDFTNWYSYFTQRIKSFSLGGSGTCEDGVIAYVSGGRPTMFVCPDFFKSSLIELSRVSVMLHEARHLDGFRHITCTRGPRAGVSGACDRRISDKGSYAISVESLAQISKYAKGLNPALRMFAASDAIANTSAFEESPRVDLNDYLILKSADGQILKIDTSLKSLETLNIKMDEGKWINRYSYTVVLPNDRNNLIEAFADIRMEKVESKSKFIEIYKNSTPAERTEWVDINYGKVSSIIKKTQVDFHCSPTATEPSVVRLPAGAVPASMIYPFGEVAAGAQAKDYLLTESGEILELTCDTPGNGSIKKSTLAFDRAFSRIYNVNGLVFGLGADGKLYKMTGTTSELVAETSNLNLTDVSPRRSYLFFQ